MPAINCHEGCQEIKRRRQKHISLYLAHKLAGWTLLFIKATMRGQPNLATLHLLRGGLGCCFYSKHFFVLWVERHERHEASLYVKEKNLRNLDATNWRMTIDGRRKTKRKSCNMSFFPRSSETGHLNWRSMQGLSLHAHRCHKLSMLAYCKSKPHKLLGGCLKKSICS